MSVPLSVITTLAYPRSSSLSHQSYASPVSPSPDSPTASLSSYHTASSLTCLQDPLNLSAPLTPCSPTGSNVYILFHQPQIPASHQVRHYLMEQVGCEGVYVHTMDSLPAHFPTLQDMLYLAQFMKEEDVFILVRKKYLKKSDVKKVLLESEPLVKMKPSVTSLSPNGTLVPSLMKSASSSSSSSRVMDYQVLAKKLLEQSKKLLSKPIVICPNKQAVIWDATVPAVRFVVEDVYESFVC